MLKNNLIIILIIIMILKLLACNINNRNANRGLLIDEETIGIINEIKKENNNIYDLWIGFNPKGELQGLAWTNEYITLPERKLFDNFPAVNYVHTLTRHHDYYNFYSYMKRTREEYKKFVFTEERGRQLKEGQSYYDGLEEHIRLDNLVTQEKTEHVGRPNSFYYEEHEPKYKPHEVYKRQIQTIFKDILIDIDLVEYKKGFYKACVKVESSGNGTITDKIAELLVFSFGRFYSSWISPIDKIKILYKENGENIFEVEMEKGRQYYIKDQKLISFNPTSFYDGVLGGFQYPPDAEYIKGFKRWLDSGLKANDWINNSAIEVYDENFDKSIFHKSNYEGLLEKKDLYNPGYEKVMEKIMGFDKTKDVLLAYNGNQYKALITMAHSNNKVNFKNQMDMTNKLMKLPVEEIWFKVEDIDKTVSMTLIDRTQYNILTYMQEDKGFDFKVEDWPIMVRYYGEVIPYFLHYK